MARCRKILANGKRCRASAISGTSFCLFHTPGKGMRRSNKKKVRTESRSSSEKNAVRRTTENQIAVRGSKKLAASTVAYGAYMQNRPDSRIVKRQYSGRFRRDGSAIVRPHEVKVTEFTTSEKGKNFKQTDGSSKRRISMGKGIVFGGRLVPVLGYGYAVHNTLGGGQVMREGEGHPIGAAAWAAHDIKQTGMGNTFRSLRDSINPLIQFNKMKEVKPFWK